MRKIVRDSSEVSEAVAFLKRQVPMMYGVDTETTGLDPHSDKIILIQVGNKRRQYVFDVARCGTSIYELIDYLNRKDVVKIFHNAKFDYGMFKTNFNVDLPNIKCTFLAEKLLTQGKNIKRSLDTVLNKYLGIKISKGEQSSFIGMEYGDEFTEAQLEYAGEDVRYSVDLYKRMSALLAERGMSQPLAQIEYECARVTGDMEVNGISINKEHWISLKDDAQKRLYAAKEKLDAEFLPHCNENLFGEPTINYNSPSQIQPILETLVGEKLDGTGKRILERLASNGHNCAQNLLDFREAAKKISTYGQSFLDKNVHPITGKIHSSFNQLGTDTGRYSSSDCNLQNVPRLKVYRQAFVATNPNYKIITADFSSQELKLLAYISKDPVLLKAAKEDKDLHCVAASVLYGIDYEDFFDEDGEVREDMAEKYRTPAKNINFGLIYGMGPSKLADKLEITKSEAYALMDLYFQSFPSVKARLQEFEEYVTTHHKALSPLDGRMMDLTSIDWDHGGHVAHAKNQAKNFPFQGSGATITKFALCRVKRKIEDYDYNAKIVITVHDEIVVEVHKNEVNEVARMVETEMEKAFNFFAPGISMKVKAEIGDTWTK
jgi:DNA polymerase I